MTQARKKNMQASYVITLIAKLYQIEKQLKDQSAKKRYEQRLARSKPIIDKLRDWLKDCYFSICSRSIDYFQTYLSSSVRYCFTTLIWQKNIYYPLFSHDH